ncbi:MAG: HAD-IB family hydrolase [Succinivibrio sp.]|nr:HAD-IB family hydrolase [Succinivibrio sp.]
MATAFFDMDGTLINGDTNDQSTRYYVERQLAAPDFLEPLPGYVQSFFAGKLKVTQFLDYVVSPLLPLSAAQQQEVLRNLVRERIVPLVKPGALKAIRAHQERHDTLVIVSSTADYIVREVGRALGIPHVIAAPIGVDSDGRITGGVVGTVPYQEGKVICIDNFIRERQLGWEDSSAYGDSVNDLPMLLKAEHRYAIDPNEQLRAHPDFGKLICQSWL